FRAGSSRASMASIKLSSPSPTADRVSVITASGVWAGRPILSLQKTHDRNVGQNWPVLRRVAVAVLALLLAGPAARAAAPPLPTRLAQALAVPHVRPAASGAVAVDLRTFATVFERNGDASLVPASNEKLAVTFAALVQFGPSYRFRTEVLGTGYRDGPVWYGDLFLKGYGDPTL